MTRILEAAGITVVHSTLGGSALDGVTFRPPGLAAFVMLNIEQPADCMRFTLAHELGHFVMHHSQPTQNLEQEASEFANAFLMPPRDIRLCYTRSIGLRLLVELKPVWRVSMASLLMRARSIGLLAYNQERYLWQQFSMAKIRQSEPPELDFPAEAPTVLPDLVDAHIRRLGYTIADLGRLLHVQPSDLASLYGLDPDAGSESCSSTPRQIVVFSFGKDGPSMSNERPIGKSLIAQDGFSFNNLQIPFAQRRENLEEFSDSG